MGLLQGFGAAVKEGLASYNETRKLREDRDLRNRQIQSQDMQNGLLYNPDTSTYDYTPEKKAQMDFESKKRASEAQNFDPNAQRAVAGRDLANKFGIQTSGQESLSDLEPLLPLAEKYQAVKLKGQEIAATRENTKATREAQLSEKKKEAQAKAYSELRDHLEKFKGNQSVQQAATSLLNAKNALSLIENTDPDKLSPQQVQLFTGELAKIATGGVPTEHGMETLTPQSGQKKLAEIVSYLQNEPEPAKAGAFIKQNAAYLHELQGNAENTVKSFRKNVAKGYKGRVRPEDYEEALKDYELQEQPQGLLNQPNIQLGQQGGGLIPSAQAAAQDPDALKFSQMHNLPYDQAKAILDKRRGK